MARSPSTLSPYSQSPEIARQSQFKRHSLSVMDETLHTDMSKLKIKQIASTSELRKISSKGKRRCSSFLFKIVVLGSKAVGKTSLIRRFVENEFSNKYLPTVSDIFEKSVCRADDEAVYVLKIHDTAGDLQYEFPAMYPLTIADADMFILVYSIENRKSLKLLENTWRDISDRKFKNAGGVPIVLVGNKRDVGPKRVVSEVEGQVLADVIQCPFFEVSAKTDRCEEVDEIVNALLQEVDKRKKAALKSGKPGGFVKVDADLDSGKTAKGRCCMM